MTTDLAHLRELRAKATPGEWQVAGQFSDRTFVSNQTDTVCKCDRPGTIHARDARLIAALHNATPALLDELEALRAENELLRARVAELTAPMTEKQIVACLAEAGCLGTIRMTYDSGPYGIARTSLNADKFVRAIERFHAALNPPGEKHDG